MYTIALGERSERQSSSGVIAATGTDATGWADWGQRIEIGAASRTLRLVA